MARKLKAALANYQHQIKQDQSKKHRTEHVSKLKIEQKAAQAARARTNSKRQDADPWIPFAIKLDEYTDKTIVLVGEGDCSFAVSVIEKYPNLPLIATTSDSREELERKYSQTASQNMKTLDELEVPVLTGIDATKSSSHRQKSSALQSANIGMIVFNFPHSGNSMADQDRNIRQHQQSLLKFFQQCAACNVPKVVVTSFDGEPYVSWQPKQLARSAGYKVERSGRFPWEALPKYFHQLTNKGNAHTSKTQSQRQARMYLWVRSGSETPDKTSDRSKTQAKQENKRNGKTVDDGHDDDDDE